MIKRRCLVLMLVLSSFLLTVSGSAMGADLSEPYPLPFLSFLRYHVVESNWDGDMHIRTLKLEVGNTHSQTLFNVKAVLDGLPENVSSVDTEVAFGSIDAGATAISNDTFQISVDMSQQSGSDLRLIWRIECDLDGEHIIDETAVIENLE